MRFNAKKLEAVRRTLQAEIDAGNIPGAAFAVGVGRDVVCQDALGYAENHGGTVRSMHLDTVFDLASLTKVVATLPSVLTLVDDGTIHLSDRLARFLPDFANGDPRRESVTIRHLLTHTSGLPSHRSYHQRYHSPADVLTAVQHEPLETPPGTRVVYSDLGFIMLGELIHVVTGQRIDEYAQKRVFQPLGMGQSGYCPGPDLRDVIAATEEVAGHGVKVGVVHDENAEALGGVAGHAGLFSRLSDLARYVQAWLDPACDVLSPAVRRAAVRCQTSGLDGRRGLGWVCRGDAYDHMGDLWPVTAVGHTGFTGTSISFDPVSQLWFILLTNDVHYGRTHKTTVRLRPRLHNLVAAAFEDVPWC